MVPRRRGGQHLPIATGSPGRGTTPAPGRGAVTARPVCRGCTTSGGGDVQGHGLEAYEEFGLAHPTPEMVNTGCALPDRRRTPACGPQGAPRGSRPAAWGVPLSCAQSVRVAGHLAARGTFPADVETVSFSAELHEGQWAGVVAEILEQRLMARLRYTDGLTYGAHNRRRHGRRGGTPPDRQHRRPAGHARQCRARRSRSRRDPRRRVRPPRSCRHFLTRFDQAMSAPGGRHRAHGADGRQHAGRSADALAAMAEGRTRGADPGRCPDSVAAMGSSMLWCVPRAGNRRARGPQVPRAATTRSVACGSRRLRVNGRTATWTSPTQGIQPVDERLGPLWPTIVWPDCNRRRWLQTP